MCSSARGSATAGGVAARVFTREAITLIHEGSGGIPRTINVICDNALLTGMALGRQKVDRTAVAEACRDLRLKSNGEQAPTGDRSNQLDDLSRRSDAKADQSHRSDAKADQSRRSDAKADEKTAVGLRAPAFTLRASGRTISE